MKAKLFISILMIGSVLCSCKKWKDPAPVDDPRIGSRKYCNDPEAVNYNWDFPGTPDNTVCFYPSDVFKGVYSFTDSIYRVDNSFDSVRSLTTFTLHLIPLSKNRLAVVGFCGITDSLKFRAERSSYRANADSTISTSDTTVGYGQFFCTTLDTLTGYFTKQQLDTSRIFIEFKVLSDTGINYHRGTAIKQ